MLELIRELAEYERLSAEVVATEELVRRGLFGSPPAAEAAIAEAGDDVVGFALWFTTFSTFVARPGLWVEDLFVRPEHRGAGAGRALLEHIARLAVERGCGRLELAALDWNEPALGFYRSLGACSMNEWVIQRFEGDALRELASSGARPHRSA